jgi:hypothetical protein
MLRPQSSCRPAPRRGVVAVLVAGSLVVVLGVAAIALDGGILVSERRRAQATADAAALAAAADLYENYPANNGADLDGTAYSSALAVAAANGYANDGTSSEVTVNVSPRSYQGGPRAGQPLPPGFVEVVVQSNQKRGFSSVFGSGDLVVRARAVARGQYVAAPAIVVLDMDSRSSLGVFNGDGDIQVVDGTVVVNSDHRQAAVNGTLADMVASDFRIAGGVNTIGRGSFIGNIESGARRVPDPFRFLPVPDPQALPIRSLPDPVNGVYHLQPGFYDCGISIPPTASVEMAPGIYYMNGGGFTFVSSGTLTGHGVMIYHTPHSPKEGINIGGTGSVTLSPPTSGPYQGITIFQDRDAPGPVNIVHHDGNGNYDITGAIYSANGRVMITRKLGDVSVGTQFVSRTLFLTGSGPLNVTGSAAKTRILGLVE